MSTRLAPLVLFLIALGGTARPSAADEPAQASAEPSGPLLLIGGRHQDLANDFRDQFFRLAGGPKAKIVVIPTAVSTPEDETESFLQPWQVLKPQSVQVLHTRDRKRADDPAFVRPITEATAVFFSNGHRDRIFKAYRGTLVEKELKKLRARGGLIGGTGTGAVALGEVAIDRANEDRLTEPGLAMLSGFLIEDGRARERIGDAVAAHAGKIGLTIPPGTAVEIHGNSLRVLGVGTVTVQWAKGSGKEATIETYKPGAQVDLGRLRRAAASRAAKDNE
jgi:cyanophycinase